MEEGGLAIPFATGAVWTVQRLFRTYGRAYIEAQIRHERAKKNAPPLNAGRLIGACRENWARFDPVAHRAKLEAQRARQREAAAAQARAVEAAKRAKDDAEAYQRARDELRRRLGKLSDRRIWDILAELPNQERIAFLRRGNRGPREIALSPAIIADFTAQLDAIESGTVRTVPIDLTA